MQATKQHDQLLESFHRISLDGRRRSINSWRNSSGIDIVARMKMW